MKKFTKEHFVSKAREKHGEKYDYSLTEYDGVDNNVLISCPLHGVSEQTPYNHIKGNGCKSCGLSVIGKKLRDKKMLEKSKIINPTVVGAKTIPLTKGHFAIVDEEDYEMLMKYNWTVTNSPTNHTNYASGGRKMKMHRFIMNAPEDKLVDHINRNGLDNRKANLRFCTKQGNSANSFSENPSKSSKYKGVCWEKYTRKWAARIRKDGRSITIGRFLVEKDAAFAYNTLAKEAFGEFAYLNILDNEE